MGLMPEQRTFIAIDLKSFYASVECVDRGLDPLTTNLVVADVSRTEKTICLAVSPSLKAYGIGGRARLFEVVQRMREVNYERQSKVPSHRLTGKSASDIELKQHPDWAVDYIAAPPQMAHYIEVSTEIYKTYLKYIAPEDIHVYSIDEVIMDVTAYLGSYKLTAHELAMKMIRDVLSQTGITATAGIGTNMYLCKVAMDIVAKKMPADKDGVRIAEGLAEDVDKVAATTTCLFFGFLDGATTISESCGGGGGNNELPKKKDNEDELSFARRCHQMAKSMHAPRYRLRRG